MPFSFKIRFEPMTVDDVEITSWLGGDPYLAAAVDQRTGVKAAMLVFRRNDAPKENWERGWEWHVCSGGPGLESHSWRRGKGTTLRKAMQEAENVVLTRFDGGYESYKRPRAKSPPKAKQAA